MSIADGFDGCLFSLEVEKVIIMRFQSVKDPSLGHNHIHEVPS